MKSRLSYSQVAAGRRSLFRLSMKGPIFIFRKEANQKASL